MSWFQNQYTHIANASGNTISVMVSNDIDITTNYKVSANVSASGGGGGYENGSVRSENNTKFDVPSMQNQKFSNHGRQYMTIVDGSHRIENYRIVPDQSLIYIGRGQIKIQKYGANPFVSETGIDYSKR